MTTTPTAPAGATGAQGAGRPSASLDGYVEAMEKSGLPVLGYAAWYTINDGEVMLQDLERWFEELNLIRALLPAAPRAVDAFEKVTGETRRVYPVDGRPPRVKGQRGPRRRLGERQSEATLFVEHVARDNKNGWIERHLVRKVRDEENVKIEYKTKLAWCVFQKDKAKTSAPGAGAMAITLDHAAIAELPEAEREQVTGIVKDLEQGYEYRRRYLSAERLRAMVRDFVSVLDATLLKPAGGIYFVPRQHTEALSGLRELLSRFGNGSRLDMLPVPEIDEMREAIIAAFTAQAIAELNKLSTDLNAALSSDKPSAELVSDLTGRFEKAKSRAAEHADLLNTTLTDAEAALQAVNMQVISLAMKQ